MGGTMTDSGPERVSEDRQNYADALADEIARVILGDAPGHANDMARDNLSMAIAAAYEDAIYGDAFLGVDNTTYHGPRYQRTHS